MPMISVNGASLHYDDTHAGSETIVFAHGLLWSGEMFGPQVEALRGRYRCITFDFRGQGRSDVTASGYDFDTLANDAIALIDALKLAPVHFVGLSMGGMIGMRIAARRPELFRSLALLETSADAEPKANVPKYRALGFVGRWFGFGLVAGQAMDIMFGKTFMNDPARETERDVWRAKLMENDRVGVQRALGGVLDRDAIFPELGRIVAPTLVLVGDEDVATVPAKAERIASSISGSRLVVIPRAGHSSTLEEPEAVSAALATFLDTLPRGAAAVTG